MTTRLPIPRLPHIRRPLAAAASLLLLVTLTLSATSSAGQRGKKKKKNAAPSCGVKSTDLDSKYQQWLSEQELLLSDFERDTLICLQQDYQRDAFIAQFWKSRDPYPDTPRNEFREQWESRLADTTQLFEGLADERAHFFLLNGPPSMRFVVCPPRSSAAVEAWFYGFESLADVQEAVYRGRLRSDQLAVVFHRRFGNGPWIPYYPSDKLFDLGAGGSVAGDLGAGCKRDELELAFRVIGLISSRGGPLGFEYEQQIARRLLKPEPASQEWVQTFVSYSTDIPPEAPRLEANASVSYPGRRESRTIVQAAVALRADSASLGESLGHQTYAFELIGEVLNKDFVDSSDRLFETFRYRFELRPEQLRDGTAPLVAQRYLRPGAYQMVLRIDDLNGPGAWRQAIDLEVPEISAENTSSVLDDLLGDRFEEANLGLAKGEPGIRILEQPQELVSGYLRFATDVRGPVDSVEFLIDEQPILKKRQPPFSLDLDLGNLPRSQVLRAIAYDSAGAEIASDSYMVNGSPHRFSVRLVTPIPGHKYQNSTRVRIEATVPEGRSLERVEVFRNEDLVATLYQPPFVQVVDLPEGNALAVIRTAAHLEDGAFAEDTVLINSPSQLEEVSVDFVELFTTVTDKQQRPLLDLQAGDFTVLEDGVPQQVARFERVDNTPLRGAVLLDVSASMEDRLDQSVLAAARFFEQVVTERDEMALIAFNDRPQMAASFTQDPEVFAMGLLGLRAERGTALFDSLIFALFHLNGLPGQRVVLLLSDGVDEHSRYGFEQALEYAKRSEAAIYAIGIDLPNKAPKGRRGEDRPERPQKVLSDLSEATGGRAFFIESIDGLAAVYDTIAQELRSKYLVAYQSSNTSASTDFRRIEVKVRGHEGAEARTLRGYFP